MNLSTTLAASGATGSADSSDPVSRFLAAIEAGTGIPAGVFAANAIVDATVPGWRFTTRGSRDIEREFGRWFADAGRFEEIVRTPLPEGELLEFTLVWSENGMRHAAHQVHRLEVDAGLIRADHAWCGGRWPEPLLTQMEAADAAMTA